MNESSPREMGIRIERKERMIYGSRVIQVWNETNDPF